MEIFKDYFAPYVTNYTLSSLGDAEIAHLLIKRESREIELILKLKELVPFQVFESAEREIKEKMDVTSVHIKPRYLSSLFEPSYMPTVFSFVKRKKSIANGFLEGATATVDGNTLTVNLAGGGAEILNDNNVASEIAGQIYDMFGINFTVTLKEKEGYDVRLEYEKRSAERENEIKQEKKVSEEQKPAKPVSHKMIKGTPLYADTTKLVFGTKLPTAHPTPIAEIEEDSRVTLWGDIISCRLKTGKKNYGNQYGKVTLWFNITDYTSTVTVEMYAPFNTVDAFLKKVLDGRSIEILYDAETIDLITARNENTIDIDEYPTVLVSGKYEFDNRRKEYCLMPDNIASVLRYTKDDTSPEKRVELHCHTIMSAMDAITPIEQVIKRAAKWGHKAIAITDHGVVQALPRAYSAARAAGIKLILGMEGYLVDDINHPDFMDVKSSEFRRYHIIILIKNAVGRKNLYKLISESNLQYFRKRPLLMKSHLAEHREGLIIGSACEQGEVYQAILEGISDEELDALSSYYDYLEIQPNGNNAFMLRTGNEEYYPSKNGGQKRNVYWRVNSEEDLIDINKRIVASADRLGKMTVATGDVHFLDETDGKYRAVIMASQGFTDADKQATLYFKTTDEMLEDFSWAGERAKEFVIENPNKIADMTDDDLPPIPNGEFRPNIEGANDEFLEKCYTNAKNMYGDPLPSLLDERLKMECDAIVKNSYAGLYIIARRLVENSEKNGYLVGSRGSVGSSVAAYFCGITEVNPLPPHYVCPKCRHSEFFTDGSVGSGFDLPEKKCPKCGEVMKRDGQDIPFETFLGFTDEKAKVPDIDLNFSNDFQTSSHRYTEQLFGKDNVFKAGTIQEVKSNTAFGFVQKYLSERNLTVPAAERDRLTSGCTGVKHATSQHPGGMIIKPEGYDIEDFTPVQYPSDDDSKGVITTHFAYKDMHDTLLKMDELGHTIPTMYKFLEDSTGIPVTSVDLCDPKLYKMLTSTKPIGVTAEEIGCPTGTLSIPEMGTPFVIGLLEESHPSNFRELVQVAGLSHGTNVWSDNAQTLIRNGTCNISEVIGCRDDIMNFLLQKKEEYEAKTGEPSPLSKKDCFDIMEIVRKGKSKNKLPKYEKAMRAVGVPDWYIDSCYKIKYLYPKAHAAAYTIGALRVGWYKIYYPVQYYSAYFTVNGADLEPMPVLGGKQTLNARLQELNAEIAQKKSLRKNTTKESNTYVTMQTAYEMLCRGFEFVTVDLYKSDWRVYNIEGNKLRLPFSAIPGVGETAARAIADAVSEKGEITSCRDLCDKAGVGQSVIESLRSVGALQGLPQDDQMVLF